MPQPRDRSGRFRARSTYLAGVPPGLNSSNVPNWYVEDCHCGCCFRITDSVYMSKRDRRTYSREQDVNARARDLLSLCEICGVFHTRREGSRYRTCERCNGHAQVRICGRCDAIGHDLTGYRVELERFNEVRFPDVDYEICMSCASQSPEVECAECGIQAREYTMNDCGEDGSVCTDCFRYYQRCPGCTRWIRGALWRYRRTLRCLECLPDDTAIVCINCRAAGASLCSCYRNAVRNYTYRPTPYIYLIDPKKESQHSSVFFGTEIEISTSRRYSYEEEPNLTDKAAHILRAFHGDETPESLAFCKSDSSINCGFEFVTMPFSWAWLRLNRNRFKLLFEAMTEVEMTGSDSSCGMHIHISRSALPRMKLYKLLRFIYSSPSFTAKLARRRGSSFQSYGGTSGQTEAWIVKQKAKGEGRYARGTAVNVNNHDTVELRLFRSAESFEDFMYNMEAARALLAFCNKQGWIGMQPSEFEKYVEKNSQMYRHLAQELLGIPIPEQKGS